MKRVIFDVLLFISIFILPWWVTLILAVCGLFIFKNFIEFLISNIIVYVISTGKAYVTFRYFSLVYLIIILFYLIAQFIRRHIILYKNNEI